MRKFVMIKYLLYTDAVSGNWRPTFQLNDDGAAEVNLEDYHSGIAD